MVRVTFFALDLSLASFIQEICWHFDAIQLISQQHTRRDLKPVTLLVLPNKVVFHAFFPSFISSYWFLVTPLFIQLFCNNIFTFFVLCFFLNKQASNFHTLIIWTDIVRIVTVQKYTMDGHN